jgi:hypothetical protein
MRYSMFYIMFVCTFSMVLVTSACAQKKQDLMFLLSDRHHVPSVEFLEERYPSVDALVSDLLELRLTENPPFVALRAEELLLEYTDREDVLQHLEEDLQHPDRKGLARVIIRGLYRIHDKNARTRFSDTSAKLVRTDPFFSPLRVYMENSPDPVVKKAIGK